MNSLPFTREMAGWAELQGLPQGGKVNANCLFFSKRKFIPDCLIYELRLVCLGGGALPR
jgi:hypothetical protein